MEFHTSNQKSSKEIRYIICEWIYQVCEKAYPKRNYSRVCFLGSVHCFDFALKNLNSKLREFHFQKPKLDILQLLAIGCIQYVSEYLFQTSKLPHLIPPLVLLHNCGLKFQSEELLNVYQLIKNHNVFQHSPFLLMEEWNYVSSQLELISQHPEKVKTLSLVLIDSYHLEYPSQRHSSSEIIQASLAVAEILIQKSRITCQINQLPPVYREMFYTSSRLFSHSSPV